MIYYIMKKLPNLPNQVIRFKKKPVGGRGGKGDWGNVNQLQHCFLFKKKQSKGFFICFLAHLSRRLK